MSRSAEEMDIASTVATWLCKASRRQADSPLAAFLAAGARVPGKHHGRLQSPAPQSGRLRHQNRAAAGKAGAGQAGL